MVSSGDRRGVGLMLVVTPLAPLVFNEAVVEPIADGERTAAVAVGSP